MTKFIKVIQTYLIFALPLVLICMAWSSLVPQGGIASDNIFSKAAWEVLSWNLMLWFATLIIFLILLVLVPEARERTLKRLAGLKERDEREQQITGLAARSAYVATMGLLICLLFFSIFSLNVYRVPEAEAIEGRRGNLSIGFHFQLLDKPRIETDARGQVLFESKDIPLSKTAILLIIIVWQLAAFRITARKQGLAELE